MRALKAAAAAPASHAGNGRHEMVLSRQLDTLIDITPDLQIQRAALRIALRLPVPLGVIAAHAEAAGLGRRS